MPALRRRESSAPAQLGLLIEKALMRDEKRIFLYIDGNDLSSTSAVRGLVI